MRINDMLLEATHPLFETVLPSYHPTVRLGEDLARTLTEAALTVDQIAQLFAQVEKDVSAKGGNRTILGKGVDAAVTVKKAYDWLKDLAEKGGQVSGFEGAYNKVAQELKNASGGDEGAVMKYIEKYRALAKNNPMAQKAIYGGLVLATGIAGYVGMGPAYIVLKPAVLGIMKFIDKLVQGEGITKSAIAGAEVFVAADIMKWAGGAIKTLVAGGIPTPPSIPAAGAGAAAADAAATEPDASKLPGGDTGMADREVRSANMQQTSNDMEKNAPAAASEPTTGAPPTKSPTLPKSFSGPGTINPTTNQWEPYTVKQQGIAPANIADISPEDLKKGNFPGPKTFDTTTNQWKPLTSPTATPDAAPATTTEPTKAAAPKLSKDFSLASNALGGDIFDAVKDDPKARGVIDYLTKDLDAKFSKIEPGKLGSNVLQDIQKVLLKQVNSLYPDDAELFLNAQQKKELVYQLMARAQDSFVESSPRLFNIVSDTTNNLFDKIRSGSIKNEIELYKFISDEIVNQNPDLKNQPGVITILHQKSDSILKSIYSDALDVDPKFTKNPEWKIKAIQQYLSKKESINFDRPALTESQVIEAFRGTMFHKDTLTEAQVRKLFQQISEGPWGALQQVGGKIAQAAKQAGSAVAGSRVGQATSKAAGAVAKQIGTTAGNLANKVTADKLMSAWKAAGSKTDSNDIYEFLKSQGIDETVLKDAFKAAGIKLTAVKVSPQYKKLSAIVTKLSPEDQQKLIQYLQAA